MLMVLLWSKFYLFIFLGVSYRILWKNENAVYCLQIPALVREILKYEKCVKYANEMTDDVIHSTQYYTNYILLPKQVDCFFPRRTKQLPLARKANVLGHVRKCTWAHSFVLSSSVFTSRFFWILSVVYFWLLLLVQHDKYKGYCLCFCHG